MFSPSRQVVLCADMFQCLAAVCAPFTDKPFHLVGNPDAGPTVVLNRFGRGFEHLCTYPGHGLCTGNAVFKYMEQVKPECGFVHRFKGQMRISAEPCAFYAGGRVDLKIVF